jgi:hypothetical protein
MKRRIVVFWVVLEVVTNASKKRMAFVFRTELILFGNAQFCLTVYLLQTAYYKTHIRCHCYCISWIFPHYSTYTMDKSRTTVTVTVIHQLQNPLELTYIWKLASLPKTHPIWMLSISTTSKMNFVLPGRSRTFRMDSIKIAFTIISLAPLTCITLHKIFVL